MEFKTNLSDENAVPFEVVIFFLRKYLKQILQTKNFSFALFIPLLAIELKKMKTQRLMAKFLPERRSGLMQIPVFQNGMRKRICERSFG
jgi:hypothetical protein